MASWGGHTLPGTFFILFGIFYAFKFSRSYLKRSKAQGDVSYCCRGRLACSGIVIEGVIKVFMISIGILVELFYPGAPMGRLHTAEGDFTHPMNWQHATMYFFFGLSGLADILSHTARHVLPRGVDRIFGALALFIEGYLFYFHLHGRSDIDTRVHILLVLAVWPGALATFLHCLVMKNRKVLHIFEMLTSVFLILQGTWFWQAAYILYPPDQHEWDPCAALRHTESASHMQHDLDDAACNAKANSIVMFITLFWSWHVASACIFVGFIYFFMYQYLKWRGKLDPSFMSEYDEIQMDRGPRIHSATPLNQALLSEEDEIEM